MNTPRHGQGIDSVLPNLLNPRTFLGSKLPMCSSDEIQLGELTQRDAVVAATIFQWCGTHIGRTSLSYAFEKAEFTLSFKKIENKK